MLQDYRVEKFIHPDVPKITIIRKDTDELISELNNIRSLIHRQLQQLENFKKTWEPEAHSEDDLVKISSKTFLRVFEVMKDFYMNLESIYIANTARHEQIDMLKDVIFELNEVKNNPSFQDRINKLFSSSNEAFEEQRKSFMRTYGIDESSNQ